MDFEQTLKIDVVIEYDDSERNMQIVFNRFASKKFENIDEETLMTFKDFKEAVEDIFNDIELTSH